MKIEELLQAVGTVAEMLRIYRDALINEGFTRDEAIRLCEGYAVLMLDGNRE